MSEEEKSSQLSPWDDGDTIFDDPDAARQIGEDAAKDMAGYVRDAIDEGRPPAPPPPPRPSPPPNRRIRESEDRDERDRPQRRRGIIARFLTPDQDSSSSESSESSEPPDDSSSSSSVPDSTSTSSVPENTSSTTSAGSLSIVAMKCSNRRCCNHLIKVVPEDARLIGSGRGRPTAPARSACEMCGEPMSVITRETLVDDNRDQTVHMTAECRLCGLRMSKVYEIQTLRHIRLTAMCQCGRPMRLLSCETRRRSRSEDPNGSSSSS